LHPHRGVVAGHDPRGEIEYVGGREELTRSSDVAQARSQVDSSTDVVVALEQDHRARGDAPSQRQPSDPGMTLLDRECCPDHRLGFDAHQHETVAEPLLDANAEEWRYLPHRSTQVSELAHRAVIAVVIDEVSEAAQVDERERAVDPM